MKIKDYKAIRTLMEYTQDPNDIALELIKLNKELKLKESKLLALEYIKGLKEEMPSTLVQRFTIGGVEFGFIPDLEEMTTAEYLDINSYQDSTQHIEKLMAVLYRPIVKTKGKKYKIEDYEGSSKYSEVMLEVDSSIYLSAISFFFRLLGIFIADMSTSSEKSPQ